MSLGSLEYNVKYLYQDDMEGEQYKSAARHKLLTRILAQADDKDAPALYKLSRHQNGLQFWRGDISLVLMTGAQRSESAAREAQNIYSKVLIAYLRLASG